MFKRTIILTITFFILFSSCEKDIELNDDYKDTTIVYGLIDPADSISYIRIEKAFLSDGDIYQDGQIPDSNLYNYKLDVRIVNEAGEEVVVFDTITIYNKDDGIFYAPAMQIYYAVTKDLFNDEDTYHLEVYNPKLNKYISSTSKFIDGRKLNLLRPVTLIAIEGEQTVKFECIKGVGLYGLNIRFHYVEENIHTGDSVSYYIDWIRPSLKHTYTSIEVLKMPYIGDEFYANLRNNIAIKENVIRHVGHVEIILSVADDMFNLYMEINKPSASLVIDRPVFTNVEGAYGIFASRSKKRRFVSLNSKSKNLLFAMEDLNFQ